MALKLFPSFEGNLRDFDPKQGSVLKGLVDALHRFRDDIQKNLTSIEGSIPVVEPDVSAYGVLAPHKNLVNRNNATTPNSKFDVTADELVVTNASQVKKRLISVNRVIDITVSGADGLDTGAEAANTWYHVWIIAKEDGTVAGLLSSSSTTPTLPSGYTYKGYVGAVRNDASSNFIGTRQRDTFVGIVRATDLAAGNAAAFTAVTVTIPTTARKWVGHTGLTSPTGNGVAGQMRFLPATAPSALEELIHRWEGDASIQGARPRWYTAIRILESSTIYYRIENGTNVLIETNGWEF